MTPSTILGLESNCTTTPEPTAGAPLLAGSARSGVFDPAENHAGDARTTTASSRTTVLSPTGGGISRVPSSTGAPLLAGVARSGVFDSLVRKRRNPPSPEDSTTTRSEFPPPQLAVPLHKNRKLLHMPRPPPLRIDAPPQNPLPFCHSRSQRSEAVLFFFSQGRARPPIETITQPKQPPLHWAPNDRATGTPGRLEEFSVPLVTRPHNYSQEECSGK
jgi:hypothetical protein